MHLGGLDLERGQFVPAWALLGLRIITPNSGDRWRAAECHFSLFIGVRFRGAPESGARHFVRLFLLVVDGVVYPLVFGSGQLGLLACSFSQCRWSKHVLRFSSPVFGCSCCVRVGCGDGRAGGCDAYRGGGGGCECVRAGRGSGDRRQSGVAAEVVGLRHTRSRTEPARAHAGMVTQDMAAELSPLILEGGEWRIGLIGAGDSRGSAVLVWPLGTDYFDLVFDTTLEFMGIRSEDPVVLASGDASALRALDDLEVDWWAPGPSSLLAAQRHFPGTRAALGELPGGRSS
jgi:hypothetical protein